MSYMFQNHLQEAGSPSKIDVYKIILQLFWVYILSWLTFRKRWYGYYVLTSGYGILPLLFPRHSTCLSKPSNTETKAHPHQHHHQNALLLSLDLSLAAHLPLLSCWKCLTRLDVQLERMFALTLPLRGVSCYAGAGRRVSFPSAQPSADGSALCRGSRHDNEGRL